jgi:hypothetical protein
LFAVVLAACMPKVRKDPQCNLREQEILQKLKARSGTADVQVTGEWGGQPSNGITWVMNQRGSTVKIDVGQLERDDHGRERYQVAGTMDGVIEGSTLYYHERGAAGATSFGRMTVGGRQMTGPRWAIGGGECYLVPEFKRIRLQ